MKKPETSGEHNTVDVAKEVLKDEEGWINRKDLGKKIGNHEKSNISKAYARANLSTFREYLESKGLETKEEPAKQGRETVFWRYKE